MALIVDHTKHQYITPNKLEQWKQKYKLKWEFGASNEYHKFQEISHKLASDNLDYHKGMQQSGMYIYEKNIKDIYHLYDFIMYKSNINKLPRVNNANEYHDIFDMIDHLYNLHKEINIINYTLLESIADIDYPYIIRGSSFNKNFISNVFDFITLSNDICYYNDMDMDYENEKIDIPRFTPWSYEKIIGYKLDISHMAMNFQLIWNYLIKHKIDPLLKANFELLIFKNGSIYINNKVESHHIKNINKLIHDVHQAKEPLYYKKIFSTI